MTASPWWPTFIHLICTLCLISVPIISIAIIYNKAETGHTHHRECSNWISLDSYPLHAIGSLYRVLTHSIKDLPKLNLFNTLNKKFHFKVLNALKKSSIIRAAPWPLVLQYSIMSSISLILHAIHRPLKYVTYEVWIIFFITFCNLFARYTFLSWYMKTVCNNIII